MADLQFSFHDRTLGLTESFTIKTVAFAMATIASLTWNFLTYKYWAFREDDEGEASSERDPLSVGGGLRIRLGERHRVDARGSGRSPGRARLARRGPAGGRSQRAGRGNRRRVAARHPEVRPVWIDSPQGKGEAIKLGMAEARGEFRCFIDADNGVSFEQIDGAFELSDRYDIVIGSRYMEGGRAREACALEDDHEPRREPALQADPRARLHRHAGTDEAVPGTRRGGSLSQAPAERLRLRHGAPLSREALWAQRPRVPGELGARDRIDGRFRRDAIVSILELFQVRWYWLTGRYRR